MILSLTETAHFRSLLPLDYEWTFVDGPAECDAAPGVAAFYPPPYRCWYTTPTTAKVDLAQQVISSIVQRDGPFDAVMGFSQVSRSLSALFARLIRDHRGRPWQPRQFYVIKSKTLCSRLCSRSRSSFARPCHFPRAWTLASMHENTSVSEVYNIQADLVVQHMCQST